MTDVLVMPAFELCHPILPVIQMIANNFALHSTPPR